MAPTLTTLAAPTGGLICHMNSFGTALQESKT